MKTKDIISKKGIGLFRMLLCLLVAASASCSDNMDDDGLEPKVGATIEINVDSQKLKDEDGYNNKTRILTVGSGAATTTIPVVSNTRWSVEVTDCEGSWCAVTFPGGSPVTGNGEFVIQVTTNVRGSDNKSEPRECHVIIYPVNRKGERVEGQGYEMTVLQDRQSIAVNPSAFAAPFLAAGEVQQFTIEAGQAWTATVSEPEFMSLTLPDDPTAGLTQTEGGIVYVPATSGGRVRATVILTLGRNMGKATRRGVLTVSSPTDEFLPIRVEMNQEGSTENFGVTPTATQTYMAGGGETEFTVFSPDIAWTATLRESDAPAWLHLSTEGEGPSDEARTLTVRADRNTAMNAREATLLIMPEGNPAATREIHIIQMGAGDMLGVTPVGVASLTALGCDGTMLTFRVISLEGECEITSDCDWVTPGVERTGEGTTDISVTVGRNDTWEMRSALLTFRAGRETRTFVISQTGQPGLQPENNPTFSYPWLSSGWTYDRAVFNTVINFPYGRMPEGTTGGVILWEGDGEETATREIRCELRGMASAPGMYELEAAIDGLKGETYYSAYAFVQTPERRYVARHKLVFRTPGLFPGDGDNPPPTVEER